MPPDISSEELKSDSETTAGMKQRRPLAVKREGRCLRLEDVKGD